MYIIILDRWLLWRFPDIAKVILSGIIELSNGCIMLSVIQNPSLRFFLVSAFLSFGGICVTMQTQTVCGRLGLGMYPLGKILQTIFSILLAGTILPFLYPGCSYPMRFAWIFLLVTILIFAYGKKVVAKREKLLYNREKKPWEDAKYVVP